VTHPQPLPLGRGVYVEPAGAMMHRQVFSGKWFYVRGGIMKIRWKVWLFELFFVILHLVNTL
jgi:hypothetical protein